MSRVARAVKKAQEQEQEPAAHAAGSSPAGTQQPEDQPAAGTDHDEVEGQPSVPWEMPPSNSKPTPEPSRTVLARGRGTSGASGLLRQPARPLSAPAGAQASGGLTPPPTAPPQLRQYWGVLKRRWRTGAVILVVVVAGIATGLYLRTPVYEATGLLEIRPESATSVPVATLFSAEKMASDELETQYGILRSETLAERVLVAVARYKAADARSAPTAPLVASREPVVPGSASPRPGEIAAFRSALVVNPKKGSRLVEIDFRSPDPRLAAFAVNSVLDTYLQLRSEEAQRSAIWLEEQLQDAQQRLQASEQQLQGYIRKHGLEVVETGKGETAELANDRLAALHEALARAQTERMEKQSADEEARTLVEAREVDSPVVQSLATRLADLRREHAKLTAVFKEDYPAVKALNDQIAELERALSEESRFVVNRGRRGYEVALRKEALLRKALAEQKTVVEALSGDSANAGYQALKRDLVTNQTLFTELQQKLQDVKVSAALKAASVGIVDRAKPPTKPTGMAFPLALALAAMVGLCLGAGGMLVQEHLDTSMKNGADVETYLGVRPLGAIPEAAEPRRLTAGRLLRRERGLSGGDSQGDAKSALSDAFASLRNAVLLQDDAAASRVLLVTSAQSEEGKTTVSSNLALSLSRLNYRVLRVDGNMRYPCIGGVLGLPEKAGLVEYLESGTDWRSALHRDVQTNLDVLAGSRPRTSPADLLSLPALGHLLDVASGEYDFVVVDSPALLSHPADVHSLAAVVDNVLFVVRQGSTRREAVAFALSQMDRVSGVVLNRYENIGQNDVGTGAA